MYFNTINNGKCELTSWRSQQMSALGGVLVVSVRREEVNARTSMLVGDAVVGGFACASWHVVQILLPLAFQRKSPPLSHF